MVIILRTSQARSIAPTSTAFVSFRCRDLTPISSALSPDAPSQETAKLGPPKRNSLAIRLAIIPPSAPSVRELVSGGPDDFLKD